MPSRWSNGEGHVGIEVLEHIDVGLPGVGEDGMAIAALAQHTGPSGLSGGATEFQFDHVTAKPLSRETWRDAFAVRERLGDPRVVPNFHCTFLPGKNDLVRDTVELLTSVVVARKVELVSRIAQDVLPILGDRIQLQQVILNLVVNGIDAMKDTPSENRVVSIRTSYVENFAQLSVSDRGSGIPKDKLKTVFEPFYTNKAGGMGMGLSIAGGMR